MDNSTYPQQKLSKVQEILVTAKLLGYETISNPTNSSIYIKTQEGEIIKIISSTMEQQFILMGKHLISTFEKEYGIKPTNKTYFSIKKSNYKKIMRALNAILQIL